MMQVWGVIITFSYPSRCLDLPIALTSSRSSSVKAASFIRLEFLAITRALGDSARLKNNSLRPDRRRETCPDRRRRSKKSYERDREMENALEILSSAISPAAPAEAPTDRPDGRRKKKKAQRFEEITKFVRVHLHAASSSIPIPCAVSSAHLRRLLAAPLGPPSPLCAPPFSAPISARPNFGDLAGAGVLSGGGGRLYFILHRRRQGRFRERRRASDPSGWGSTATEPWPFPPDIHPVSFAAAAAAAGWLTCISATT